NNEMDCAKHLFQRQIDALIVSTVLPETTDFYRQSRIPVIGFDRRISSDNIMNVETDDEGDASRLAQQLLRQKSYKRILFLGALPELPTSRKRENGFCSALKERSVSTEFLYATQFRSESAARVFARWLTENSLPDAIFVTSLTLLQGVVRILLQQEKGIPKDLDIATFGDNELLDLLPNKVICCVQNYAKVADSLLHLVVSKLKNKKHHRAQAVSVRDIVYHHCG
ncbi:MAG TPA: catabolite repressor/activator, partial [Pasteurellaceae bacterium]|nr:catabolite repressor/activator [Pasteurellaceae bacterium]